MNMNFNIFFLFNECASTNNFVLKCRIIVYYDIFFNNIVENMVQFQFSICE